MPYRFPTLHGKIIDFANLNPEAILIEDIAAGLSKMCRFNGQINKFYSVAEHCIMGAKMVPKELQLAFLLHDATEGYLADIIKPAKIMLPDYNKLEQQLMEVIASRFAIDIALFRHPDIIETDNRMLVTERNQLRPNWQSNEEVWHRYRETEAYDILLPGWSPPVAEAIFLNDFNKYI